MIYGIDLQSIQSLQYILYQKAYFGSVQRFYHCRLTHRHAENHSGCNLQDSEGFSQKTVQKISDALCPLG